MASTQQQPAEPYGHLVDPDHYQRSGYPHESWRELRTERPIHFIEREQGDSYWAITKHADITAII